MRARRAAALARLAELDPPTAQLEHWRYSPIGELDLASCDLAGEGAGAAAPLPAAARQIVEGIPDRAGLVVVRDGRLASVELSDAAAGVGVRVEVTRDAGGGGDDPSLLDVPDHDALDDLHDAYVPEIVTVCIPPAAVVDGAVVVVEVAGTGRVVSFPHVVVDAGPQSEVTVVSVVADDGGQSVSVPVVEVHAGDASNVVFVGAQVLSDEPWRLGRLGVNAGRDATVRAWTLALGGGYAREYVSASLPAQGATIAVDGVYFGDGRQTLDFRSVQDHVAPRSRSTFLLKGAVVDEAHGVYTGLIRVREGAKRTDSFLTNRNLVLSEGAGVDSVPNLEIVNENDLSSCGHAAATGPVDEDHLFYLESRGVPTGAAERLIVYGFFDEVLAGVPVPAVREAARRAVAAKLDGRKRG